MGLAREQGVAQRSTEGESWRGWALVEQGQVAKGIAQMHQGLTPKRLTGAALGLPAQLAQLAEAYGKVGQVEQGLGVLAEALVTAESTGECWWEAELYRLKGELLLALFTEHQAEAETCFHQALDVAAASGRSR
jgi:predicted ATPase